MNQSVRDYLTRLFCEYCWVIIRWYIVQVHFVKVYLKSQEYLVRTFIYCKSFNGRPKVFLLLNTTNFKESGSCNLLSFTDDTAQGASPCDLKFGVLPISTSRCKREMNKTLISAILLHLQHHGEKIREAPQPQPQKKLMEDDVRTSGQIIYGWLGVTSQEL